MVASLDQMLGVQYTRGAISQVAAATSAIVQEFGMQGGAPDSPIRGKNVRTVGHRHIGWDIFNDTRAVGRSTTPGAPAAVSTRQKVGRVDVEIPRMHDSLILGAEEIHNRRVIGGSSSVFDEGGKDYIARQQRFLGQKAANFRKMLIGGLCRGQLYAHGVGTNIYYDYTSTSALWTLDYKMPTGNKTQLDMLGAGSIIDVSWANPGADIPNHLRMINAAFQQLCGSSLELVIINSKVWGYIQNNDFVIQNAGSSSTAYETYNRKEGVAENGKKFTTFEATIKAVPWVRFLITDEGLDLENSSGTTTYTKFIGDTQAWFGPSPNSDYFEMLEGGEPIAEGPNMTPVIKNGLDAWSCTSHNPTATQLLVLDNCIPANYVPNSSAFGTVVF